VPIRHFRMRTRSSAKSAVLRVWRTGHAPAPDLHVDVVRNDWVEGKRRIIGRLELHANDIEVIELDQPDLRARVTAVVATVPPTLDGQHRLAAVAAALEGPHLDATAPHTEESCPFADRTVLPIEWSEPDEAAGILLGAEPTSLPDAPHHAGHLFLGEKGLDAGPLRASRVQESLDQSV
jgi:hypothetical protein